MTIDKWAILVGGILVALIAGFFSYLNLVVSKEQKVSEFRERWICALREEISAYIAAISHLSSCFSLLKDIHKPKSPTAQDRLKFFTENASVYESVRDNYNRITLRVNPKDSDPDLKKVNERFLEALEETRELYNSNKYGDAKKKCRELRDAAIPLLKAEWNRVRDGEPQYQQAKKMAKLFLLLGLGASLISLVAAVVVRHDTNPDEKASNEINVLYKLEHNEAHTRDGDAN